MKTSVPPQDLARYLSGQVNAFFPDGNTIDSGMLNSYIATALQRLEHSFAHTARKYFQDEGVATFSHLQSDQYAMFLYLVANSIHLGGGDCSIAAKLYCLNKALHGIDVYYEVALPSIFLFRHCVGTVLGRATYADYFTVGANCTVGNSRGKYPIFEHHVAMYNGAMVLGRSTIGSNCHISANTIVLNQDVEENRVAFGRSPDLLTKPCRRTVHEAFFDSLTHLGRGAE